MKGKMLTRKLFYIKKSNTYSYCLASVNKYIFIFISANVKHNYIIQNKLLYELKYAITDFKFQHITIIKIKSKPIINSNKEDVTGWKTFCLN